MKNEKTGKPEKKRKKQKLRNLECLQTENGRLDDGIISERSDGRAKKRNRRGLHLLADLVSYMSRFLMMSRKTLLNPILAAISMGVYLLCGTIFKFPNRASLKLQYLSNHEVKVNEQGINFFVMEFSNYSY